MGNDNWYKDKFALFKMSRRLVGRELAFLGRPSVRGLKAHSSGFLRKHLDVYNVEKNSFMLYHSIASLRDMPMFSYNFVKRKEETEDFFINYESYVENYDFVLDFDHDDVSESYEDMMIVHRLFLGMDIQHEVVFSGKKGFHVEVKNIPLHYFVDLKQTVSFFKKIANYITKTHSLGTIDLNIYDQVRIWKVPYSIDSRTNLVVLPLSEYEINNFDKSLCEPEKVIKDLRGRSDYYLSKGKPENIYKFKLILEQDGK